MTEMTLQTQLREYEKEYESALLELTGLLQLLRCEFDMLFPI